MSPHKVRAPLVMFVVALLLGGCSSVLGLDPGEHDQAMDNPCGLCLRKQCGSELDACTAEPACGQADRCLTVRACTLYPSSCFNGCEAETRSTKIRSTIECALKKCKTACA